MKKLILALVTIGFAIMTAFPASASNCARDQYMHNGSRMDFEVCDGGRITISYAQPRPGMFKQGARPGTLLFDGSEGPGGVITGQSRLFSARCGVVPYAVSGSRQGNTIILNGTAPIRGRNCQVVRYRQDNLVFTLLGSVAPGPNPQPQCPPGFYLANGQCIRAGAGPAPVPVPQPGPGAGDWYAIAGSFRTPGQAQTRIGQLGGGAWYMMNTAQCPNFRNGYWIATAGPFSKGQAQSFAGAARQFGAYVKTCH